MPLRPRGAGVAALLAVLIPIAVPVPATAAPVVPGDALSISVIVPITARADDAGLLDAETLAVATSPAGVLTRELGEVLATSATIALDPKITASIRVLGTAAPESAVEWLERLAEAPNEVFLLAWSDADLSALARAGALGLALDVDLGFAIDPAAFGPAPTPTPSTSPSPSPTPTADPDDPPPLPTSEELVTWPGAATRIAWPAEGSAASADIAAYAGAGFDAVVLSSANLSETASGRADVDGTPVLVSDSAVSDLFRQAGTAVDELTRGLAIDRLSAALDGLAAAHPGRSVVLTLDRSGPVVVHGLAETYATLAARTDARFAPLAEVLELPGTPARVVDGGVTEAIARTPELVDALAAEAAFATVLEDPSLLTAPRRLEMLSLLATSETAAENWAEAADAFLAESAELLDSVAIVDTGDLLVASSTPTIPIHVANGLDFAVTVRIDVRPQRPRIRIQSPVEVTIEPGSSKAVRLEAQAITNGDVDVVVTLSSPSGVAIGQPRSLNVDLQAQWETVGIVVGALVALVFAAGIARNVIVRRRRSAGERDGEDAGSGDEGTGG